MRNFDWDADLGVFPNGKLRTNFLGLMAPRLRQSSMDIRGARP